ncbi:MAG: YitT family protein [Clostridia bacterium]|nr:YitT family protein [Clostridia bacterium]
MKEKSSSVSETTVSEASKTQEQTLPPKITKKDFERNAASRRSKILYWTKAVFFLLLSSFLVSFTSYALIAPNEFTIGGITGIAILLNVATAGKIQQSVIVFAFNLPLVVLSFFFVKKKFALLTAANIGLQTLWLLLLENALPTFEIKFGTSGEKIFAAIAAGICIGVAICLAFKIGGSTGGADILAVMIQRKFAAGSIAWMLFVINCVIICCSVFVFRGDTPAATLLPIMMSAFESYVESKTNDALTNGFQSAIEFRIITDKPEEMARALMKELSRGVTAQPAKGMYTKENRTMLLCVVSRRQVATLRRIMKETDPDSFAVMSAVSQVLGLGFYTSEM